jgi:hypothetical protein
LFGKEIGIRELCGEEFGGECVGERDCRVWRDEGVAGAVTLLLRDREREEISERLDCLLFH